MYPAQEYNQVRPKMNQTNNQNYDTPEGFPQNIPEPSAPPEISSPIYQTKPIISPQSYNPPILVQPIRTVIIKEPKRNMDKFIYPPPSRNRQEYYIRRNVYVEEEKKKKNFWKGCAAFFCCLFCCCPPCC